MFIYFTSYFKNKMIVHYSTCGLSIILNRADRESIENKWRLEAKIVNRPPQNFVLHLVDVVEENEFPEDRGFHIRAIPIDSNWETREGIEVYLSRSNFSLLLDKSRSFMEIGSYISRSRFDRIEFNYIDL